MQKIIKDVIKDIESLTGHKVVDVKRGNRGIVLIAETGAGMPKYVAYKTTVEVLENKALESFIREAREDVLCLWASFNLNTLLHSKD